MIIAGIWWTLLTYHLYIQSLRVLSVEHVKAPFVKLLEPNKQFSRHLGSSFLDQRMNQGVLQWFLLVGSHVARSLFEDSAVQTLRQELTSLRIEVHRARELISGYNEVLDSCERDYRWLQWSTKIFAIGNLLLGFVLIGLFLWLKSPCDRESQIVGNSPCLPFDDDSVELPVVRCGPARPSDRLKK